MYRLFYIILKVWSRFSFVQRYSAKLPIISGSFFHWKNKPFTFSFYISSNSRSSRKTRYLVAPVNKFIINHWLSIIIFLLTRLLLSNSYLMERNSLVQSERVLPSRRIRRVFETKIDLAARSAAAFFRRRGRFISAAPGIDRGHAAGSRVVNLVIALSRTPETCTREIYSMGNLHFTWWGPDRLYYTDRAYRFVYLRAPALRAQAPITFTYTDNFVISSFPLCARARLYQWTVYNVCVRVEFMDEYISYISCMNFSFFFFFLIISRNRFVSNVGEGI